VEKRKLLKPGLEVGDKVGGRTGVDVDCLVGTTVGVGGGVGALQAVSSAIATASIRTRRATVHIVLLIELISPPHNIIHPGSKSNRGNRSGDHEHAAANPLSIGSRVQQQAV
jgi:hypothetical protein